jgi:hypothetical protein
MAIAALIPGLVMAMVTVKIRPLAVTLPAMTMMAVTAMADLK